MKNKLLSCLALLTLACATTKPKEVDAIEPISSWKQYALFGAGGTYPSPGVFGMFGLRSQSDNLGLDLSLNTQVSMPGYNPSIAVCPALKALFYPMPDQESQIYVGAGLQVGSAGFSYIRTVAEDASHFQTATSFVASPTLTVGQESVSEYGLNQLIEFTVGGRPAGHDYLNIKGYSPFGQISYGLFF